MSTDLVGIDLFAQSDEPLAAKVRRAGQAKALSMFAGEVERAAKDDLRRAVDAEAERTGTGFSAKVDGIRATLSDPQPRPHVTDSRAFAEWWLDNLLEHEVVERVEVTDHVRAAELIAQIVDDEHPGDANDLAKCLRVRTDFVLSEKPLDILTNTGRCVATDDGLMDTETGELVPGVTWTRAEPVLSVSPDKAAKARDGAVVRSFFGLRAEIGGAA